MIKELETKGKIFKNKVSYFRHIITTNVENAIEVDENDGLTIKITDDINEHYKTVTFKSKEEFIESSLLQELLDDEISMPKSTKEKYNNFTIEQLLDRLNLLSIWHFEKI